MSDQQSERIGYREAAHFLGVNEATLRSMVHRLQIEHIRISPRLVRFEISELRRWLDSRRVRVGA